MAWVRIDEHFYDHPKWFDAPGDSIAVWVAAMAWCNRNDSVEGYIPDGKARGLVRVRQPNRTLSDLCQRGAFRKVDGGYVIHDYCEYQQPEKVKEIAAKRSASGKKGAAVRWGERLRAADYAQAPLLTDDMAPDEANAIANAMANRCPVTDTGTETDNTTSAPTSTELVPAGRAPNGAGGRDLIFDALVEACGYRYDEMTDRQRRACGVARAELARVNATPELIHQRATVFRQKHPQAALTPNALANQWAALTANGITPRLNESSQALARAYQRRTGAT